MVVTIVTQNNGETVYFDDPLPEASYVRLLSCSFYNSWHNLSRVGTMFVKDSGDVVLSLPEGHYNVESLAKELQSRYSRFHANLDIETNKHNYFLKITRKNR